MIKGIRKFTDLTVWQVGHTFVIDIYKLTHLFPGEERYGLASQMQRAAVSVISNIAEGFSRKGPKEKIQFYYLALGSLTELENQLLISKDLRYIKTQECNRLLNMAAEIGKMLNGLIKSIKKFEGMAELPNF